MCVCVLHAANIFSFLLFFFLHYSPECVYTVATFIKLTSLKNFGETFRHSFSKQEGSGPDAALDRSRHSQKLSHTSDTGSSSVVGAFSRRLSRVGCAPSGEHPPLSRQGSGIRTDHSRDSAWEQQPPGGREKLFSNPSGSSRNLQSQPHDQIHQGTGDRSPQSTHHESPAGAHAYVSPKHQDMTVEEFDSVDSGSIRNRNTYISVSRQYSSECMSPPRSGRATPRLPFVRGYSGFLDNPARLEPPGAFPMHIYIASFDLIHSYRLLSHQR